MIGPDALLIGRGDAMDEIDWVRLPERFGNIQRALRCRLRPRGGRHVLRELPWAKGGGSLVGPPVGPRLKFRVRTTTQGASSQ